MNSIQEMKSKYHLGLLNNIQKNWLPEKSLREKQVLGRKHPLIGYHGTKHGDC